MSEANEVNNKISRRNFIAGAATAVAAFTIVPGCALVGSKSISKSKPPSEKLNIAAVGIGGMGRNNVKACGNENIVALCDVDWKYAGPAFADFPNAKKYKDYRKMFDEQGKNIDAVIVATPDHSHAAIAMMAMEMGKHVYVQKPMTWSVIEARKLTETARKKKIVTQMGNQGQSAEDIRVLCEMIWAGAIGKIQEVHVWTDRPTWPQGIETPKDTPEVPADLDWDLWLGPAPVRPYNPCYHPFTWRGWVDFGTGALGDMGCHLMNHVFWPLNLTYPVSVEACVSERCVKNWEKVEHKDTYPDASIVRYTFPGKGWGNPPIRMTWYDGGLKPPRPSMLEPERNLSTNGFMFVGDKGVILEGRIIPESKMKSYNRPKKTIPRIIGTHEQNWIDACKGGPAPCSNFDVAGPLTEAVLLGCIAVRMPGKILEWDGPNMKISNNAAANEMLSRPYREGWTL